MSEGGRGGLVIALPTANPQLRGVVFDLPAVAEDAREQLRAGLAGRCDVVAGDFRDAVVPDVYLLSWILDRDDAGAVRVLRSCP
ncbi:MAG: methyltransferase [Thermoleophilia bacterium]